MKRIFIIAALTLCLLISSLSGLNVQAQEVDIDGDLLGGVFYTTLADDDIEDEMQSGMGFYLGGRYHYNEEISVIGQFERFTTSQTEDNITAILSINGLVGSGAFNISEAAEIAEVDIYGRAGIGYYFGQIGIEEVSFDLESSLGFKFGAGVEYEVIPGLHLAGNANYRILETGLEGDWGDVDDTVDLSGIEIGVGMSFAF